MPTQLSESAGSSLSPEIGSKAEKMSSGMVGTIKLEDDDVIMSMKSLDEGDVMNLGLTESQDLELDNIAYPLEEPVLKREESRDDSSSPVNNNNSAATATASATATTTGTGTCATTNHNSPNEEEGQASAAAIDTKTTNDDSSEIKKSASSGSNASSKSSTSRKSRTHRSNNRQKHQGPLQKQGSFPPSWQPQGRGPMGPPMHPYGPPPPGYGYGHAPDQYHSSAGHHPGGPHAPYPQGGAVPRHPSGQAFSHMGPYHPHGPPPQHRMGGGPSSYPPYHPQHMPPPHGHNPYPHGGYGPPPPQYRSSQQGQQQPYPGMAPPPGHTFPSRTLSTDEVGSITSNPSKETLSTSLSSNSSIGSKKRTIDGLRDSHKPSGNKSTSAFTVMRTNSHASMSSAGSTIDTLQTSESRNQNSRKSSNKNRNRGRGSSRIIPNSANLFEDDDELNQIGNQHRRRLSSSSTTSSLSDGGLSMESYEGLRASTYDEVTKNQNDDDTIESSSKRMRGTSSRLQRSGSLDTSGAPARFNHLSMRDDASSGGTNAGSRTNMFVTMSTSPINHTFDPGATPVSKNTSARGGMSGKSNTGNKENKSAFSFRKSDAQKSELLSTVKSDDGSSSTPFDKSIGEPSPMSNLLGNLETPPASYLAAIGSDMMADESLLNRHLRDQSFTPVSGRASGSNSPSFHQNFSIAPQLSWSVNGDTPPLADLGDWEEGQKYMKPSPRSAHQHHRRSGSNTSPISTGPRGTFSPTSMTLWRDDDMAPVSHEHGSGQKSEIGDARDYENILRLTTLSPNSDIMEDTFGGKTTPLPIFFSSGEDRENIPTDLNRKQSGSNRHRQNHKNDSTSSSLSFGENENGSHRKPMKPQPHQVSSGSMPLSSSSSWGTDYSSNNKGGPLHHHQSPTPSTHQSRSNYGGDHRETNRRDNAPPEYYSSGGRFGGHNGHHGSGNMMGPHDRVRNLRGRGPPPTSHHTPQPMHAPPHSHPYNHLTSPMGNMPPKPGMWPHHHGGMHPHHHHHLHHHGGHPMLHAETSKRKCVALKPPLPSKFQGDIEGMKTAQVPEFTSLVNFPVHMSQKQSIELPDGMRCCVMCGQACPCSAANKAKKVSGGKGGPKASGGLAALSSNGQDSGDRDDFAIIPTQNKGLCTNCDVNVWVVTNTLLEIKWCKGCKNFRPWAAFGEKGGATKCVRCRERQREKYALQKEEKEKSRTLKKTAPLKCSVKA